MTTQGTGSGHEVVAERYPAKRQKRRDRIFATVAAATLLAAFLIWAVAVTLAQASEVKSQTLSYRIVDATSAEVSFKVTRLPGTAVSCVLQALNESYLVVGWRQVELPESELEVAQFTETIATTEPAVTAMVDGCSSR